MSNHTPGPWTVNQEKGFLLNHISIWDKDRKAIPFSFANANLIAAAPEMLEGCAHAHDVLLSLHVCELDIVRCDSLREELRKVIAKAKEGEA